MPRPKHFDGLELSTWIALFCVVVSALWAWVMKTKSSNVDKSSKSEIKISEVIVYPIKSCAGVSVESAQIDSQSGLALDRVWMVIDSRNVFMSQRRASKMALIKPSLPADHKKPIILSAPGMDDIEVPVKYKKKVVVRCWEDMVDSFDQGDQVAEWLSTFLEIENLRLVRMAPLARRLVDKNYVMRGTRTAFSDGFPMLLASTASLKDLNEKMKKDSVPMNRFRPNIIVDHTEPWAEDTWKNIMIHSESFLVAKPCARCKMPTIDQDTGKVSGGNTKPNDEDLGGGPAPGAEPTATLRKFRTGKHLKYENAEWKDDVFFGQNIAHLPLLPTFLLKLFGLPGQGRVAVGDGVHILSYAE